MSNPARMSKPELVSAYRMLEAAHEARGAQVDGLIIDIRERDDTILVQRQELENAHAQLRALHPTNNLVSSKHELLKKLNQLCREGVPALMQGDVIKHRITRAVLYQVRH